MSLTETSKLASLLAEQTREADTTKQNVSPDDLDAALPLFDNERPIKISGEIILTAYSYATSSFILDHPILGELDSPVLELDGGYESGSVLFPLTYPISFGTESTVLYTTTF